jgi:hypothetical protein
MPRQEHHRYWDATLRPNAVAQYFRSTNMVNAAKHLREYPLVRDVKQLVTLAHNATEQQPQVQPQHQHPPLRPDQAQQPVEYQRLYQTDAQEEAHYYDVGAKARQEWQAVHGEAQPQIQQKQVQQVDLVVEEMMDPPPPYQHTEASAYVQRSSSESNLAEETLEQAELERLPIEEREGLPAVDYNLLMRQRFLDQENQERDARHEARAKQVRQNIQRVMELRADLQRHFAGTSSPEVAKLSQPPRTTVRCV